MSSRAEPRIAWCNDVCEVPCPLCGETEFRPHIYEEFAWVIVSVVRCVACDHCYANPAPTPEAAARHYNEHYINHSGTLLPSSIDQVRDPKSIWSDKMSRYRYYLDMLPHVAAAPRVLDVGCSWGGLLAACDERFNGPTLVGLDIAEQAIDFLRRSWAFSGHVATVREFHRRHPDRRFDLVVSSHSLEHSLEPRRALESMAALLDRDGILFLTLPNHDSYSRAQMGGYAPTIRGGNHYQFFSVRRLRTALEEVGLRITETFTSSAHSPHLQTLTLLLASDRRGCTFDQIDELGEGEFIYFICAK